MSWDVTQRKRLFILRIGDFLWSQAREQIFAVRDELGCHVTKETIYFAEWRFFLWSLAREQIFAVRDELGCHETKETIYFAEWRFFCGHWRRNKFLRFEMSWDVTQRKRLFILRNGDFFVVTGAGTNFCGSR